MTITTMNAAMMDNSDTEEGWEPLESPSSAKEASHSPNEPEPLQLQRQLPSSSPPQGGLQDQDMKEILDAVENLLEQQQQKQEEDEAEKQEEPTNNNNTNASFQLRTRLQNARQRLARRVVKPVAQSSVHVTRKLVTGSSTTRVRDFVVLPRVVRVLDKYTFTLGVMGMLSSEYMVLRFPQYFGIYAAMVMVPSILLRVILYVRNKQHYFLLDYCYWVNVLGFVLSLLPLVVPSQQLKHDNVKEWIDIAWQVFFVSANGPLVFALVAWNNSLVFHSFDKVTSTYLHLFPPILSACERWRSNSVMNDTTLTWSRHFGYPMAFYMIWQVVYLFQTEVWYRKQLDADPEIATSLRYLTQAEKMPIHKNALKFCRQVGLMGPTETFVKPKSMLKVKFVFVTLQTLMTVVTFFPVRLYYGYEYVHSAMILAILTLSVFNGARYYIQVFSKIHEKRYIDHETPEEDYVDTGATMSEHVKKD